MGLETVIQRIYFRNSCGIFGRDFVRINLEKHCFLIFFCLHIVVYFVVNIVNNFKACCLFHSHFFLVMPVS